MERLARRASSVVAMTELQTLMSEQEVAVAAEPVGASRDDWFRKRLELSVDGSYRLAAVILGDAREAEDVTHDALERAWRGRTGLRDPSRFDAWLSRILVNACRDRLRRRRRAPRLISIHAGGPGAAGSMEPRAADPFAGEGQRDALLRALHRLVPDQRVVIALRFYEDLEVDEIARRLGTRPGTVKSRLHRGLRALRAAWDAGERREAEADR